MKRNYVVALTAVAVLAAGVVVASNMGFKLNKVLNTTGQNGSKSGTQDIGLPFNRQTSINTAEDLRNDILAASPGGTSVSVSRYNQTTDALDTYVGASVASNFPLATAEGYTIKTSAGANYIIVGSHDPGYTVQINTTGTSGSKSGTQLYSYPYHSTSSFAEGLRNELIAQSGGTANVSVSRYNTTTDALDTYVGASVASNFPLVPGEAYTIKTSVDIAYIPSHY